MIAPLRLAWRLQRWEYAFVAFGVALTAGAMLWAAGQLDGLRISSPQCVPPADAEAISCQQALDAYGRVAGFGETLLYLSFGAPFGIGDAARCATRRP